MKHLLFIVVVALVACGSTRNAEPPPSTKPAEALEPPPPIFPDRCTLPIATTPCTKPHPQYAFDATLKACVELPVGQCPSNANDFNGALSCMEGCMKTDAMREAVGRFARRARRSAPRAPPAEARTVA